MDKVLNLDLMSNVWNWPRVWLMLAAAFVFFHLVSRALPAFVPATDQE